MPICKYFQQGNCRFGNNCRYEHSYNSGSFSSGGGTSVLRNKSSGQQFSNSYFQNSGPVRSSSNQGEVMQMVINELNQSEQGGQWPLSCFAPFKEQSCYPGLEDHSQEELRWLVYETAQSRASVEECHRQIQELYNRSKLLKHSIMNPSAETYSIIEKLSKGQILVPFSSTGSTNNFVSGNSVLGSAPVSSPFTFSLSQLGSGPDQNSAHFGGPTTVLGSLTPGVTNTTSVFGTPFSSGTAIGTGSIFGDSNQTVMAPASRVIFDNVPSNTEPMPPFNNQGRETFGSGTQWNQPEKQLQDNSIYTLITELSDEEKQIFSLKTFTMGKVPTKPPPKEMCA